jgi:hypothetical protein
LDLGTYAWREDASEPVPEDKEFEKNSITTIILIAAYFVGEPRFPKQIRGLIIEDAVSNFIGSLQLHVAMHQCHCHKHSLARSEPTSHFYTSQLFSPKINTKV